VAVRGPHHSEFLHSSASGRSAAVAISPTPRY
jgi:hypothetical protein